MVLNLKNFFLDGVLTFHPSDNSMIVILFTFLASRECRLPYQFCRTLVSYYKGWGVLNVDEMGIKLKIGVMR